MAKNKKKEYFLLFTRISVTSTRKLLGLTANIKSDLFSLLTQAVQQAWVWGLEQLRKIWLLTKEPEGQGLKVSLSPFLTGLEFNKYNKNINKSMFLPYYPLNLFRTTYIN